MGLVEVNYARRYDKRTWNNDKMYSEWKLKELSFILLVEYPGILGL